MAIPPFPSQEVAKLVLGYLAEEHLMTAYDEFLQASPYLDAYSNEYGRVFMTSLKNILAEYMAVKIYVETCKPIPLRRKLMQCTNLLEVVKLLIALVDVQKVNYQEKPRIHKLNVTPKVNSCDVCSSSNLLSCTCNSIHSYTKTQVSCDAVTVSESSVEATSLADLPGNAIVKEDCPKSVTSIINNVQKCELNSVESTVNQRLGKAIRSNLELNLNNVTSSTPENIVDARCLSQAPPLVVTNSDTSSKNIEEFDTILNIVTKQSNNSKVLSNTAVFNTGGFQEFAAGVEEKTKEKECLLQTADHISASISYNKNPNCISNTQGITNETISVLSPVITDVNKECNTIYVDEKYPEQKIKILSDIKVNNSYTKMPPVLKSTSTPCVQMQTLYINGTVAYKNKLETGTNYNYTKDEIMSMPTFILVPSSGTSESPKIVIPKSTMVVNKQNLDTVTTKTTPRVLKPLTIDVNSSRSVAAIDVKKTRSVPAIDVKTSRPVADTDSEGIKDLSLNKIDNINEIGLIKTVDLTTGSLPKETTATSLNKVSTPSVLPPMKKASSTPRRTSHIRVLDFNTPRRILNENKAEKNNNDNLNPPQSQTTAHPNIPPIPHSNISSKSKVNHQVKDKNIRTKNDENINNKQTCYNKTKDILPEKKKPVKNWDADLRALLGPNIYQAEIDKEEALEASIRAKVIITPKNNKPDKKKNSQNHKSAKKSNTTNSSKNKKEEKKKSTPKKKAKKPKEKAVESNLESQKLNSNIISDSVSGRTIVDNEANKNQVEDIEQSDTPEAERQALQNVIGAKLNISELLETPYKQALYDIQMDTPRFLGPDLPGEPMSDIKIMNIPTPRFFDTPKITQATPSSYSSRQTDYSSGGSYYKPDDQDYIPIDEVLECAITIADDSNGKPEVMKSNVEEIPEKPRRPVRKCTKNVSYRRNLSLNNRVKEEPKLNRASSLADDNNCSDKKSNKKVLSKPSRKTKSEVSAKGEVNLKNIKISPSKSESQRNLKCVPHKSSTKESNEKGNRKLSDGLKHSFPAETQSKKKTIKETATELVAAPAKSRRKSATPRKLHCTKSFNSGSCENNLSKGKEVVKDTKVLYPHDSDSEQPPLRWSDDGSQDAKSKDTPESSHPQNDEDDIDNIKKYIENCSKIVGNKDTYDNHNLDPKRTFDAETAKIIERDLLGTPPRVVQSNVEVVQSIAHIEVNKVESSVDCQSSNNKTETNSDSKMQNEDVEDEGEIELTVSNCNEDCKNYFSVIYDESKFIQNHNITRLKDKYCVELCIEDDISIRLNATALVTMFEQDPGESVIDENYINETAKAVSSISNIEKLYTPLKNARNRCLEIFDSTLTSLDTPLKNDPKETEHEVTLTEIVLEIESVQGKDKGDVKKRKRNQNFVNEGITSTKKLKTETQELLKSANIQNMDIESVLSKLHGP